MRKRNILSLARAILLSSMFGMSMALPAMPTAEEIAAAEPLVQEVMKAEMDALRSGKKTREQVGDAAVALAKAAQAPAEKYILLTGAFDYYMRGGAYDKAASALEAVRKAVPDWKGSDEFALIDKAMRVVAFGKGGPVRERYEELKERQQYASRLKKALAQAKAKPSDKKLQFQVATYSAALGHWPQAVDAFLAANSPACAAAAKLEKESAPPAKIADAWWSVVDIRPAFLSSAIRAHAVDLYKKALDSNSLAGLQKVAAEKRIQEASAAEGLEQTASKIPASKFYDKELEFIESDGGQWIETEFSLAAKGRYSIEIKTSYLPAGPEMDFWGNFGGAGGMLVGQFGGLVFGYNKGAARIDGNPEKTSATHVIRLDITGEKRSLFVDGMCIGTAPYICSEAPLSLFSGGKNYKCARAKIYYFKIQKDGKSVLDMIPVRKGNDLLMFDKVSKKTFGNAGVRKFIDPDSK